MGKFYFFDSDLSKKDKKQKRDFEVLKIQNLILLMGAATCFLPFEGAVKAAHELRHHVRTILCSMDGTG